MFIKKISLAVLILFVNFIFAQRLKVESLITDSLKKSKSTLNFPIAQVTEKERYKLSNIQVGDFVYQTDNLSGIYYYSLEGWIPIPTSDSVLNDLLICSKVTTVETVSDLSSVHGICGTAVTTAIVLGYHEKNDGGGGIFVFDSSLTDADNDNGLIFDGWRRSIVDSSINVKWFGARGDCENEDINNSDLIESNTLAFQNALSALRRRTIPVINQVDDNGIPLHDQPNLVKNRISTASIFIPSGHYIIGEDALFSDDASDIWNFRFFGIKYFSDGNATISLTNRGQTYAFKNLDQGLKISFTDITFVGYHNDTNLIYSASNGGAQDYYFERCSFLGKYDKIFTLRNEDTGDTNSEWGFLKCNFSGNVNTILDLSGSNVSDQFLNYWFDQTKFWIDDGTIIKSSKGGHFKFVNCDWSGYNPSSERYYFELNSSLSAQGVNDFRIINGRFEMKNENARVLKSNWTHGNIEINADFGSQTYRDFFDENIKHFEFNIYGTYSPPNQSSGCSLNVNFKNSVMMGYHEFNYNEETFRGTSKFLYENCSFPYRNTLDGFIKINHGNKVNKAFSNIEIRDALFANNNPYDSENNQFSPPDNIDLEISSVNYLPSYSNSGLKKKIFKIAHPARGVNPIGDQKFTLNFPVESEAIITKVHWFLPKNRLTSHRVVQFQLTNIYDDVITDDFNPEEKLEIDPVLMKDGFNLKQDVHINVKNLPEGKLVLKDKEGNADQAASEFHCIIEYY
ncbi:MAG: hypothetical protein HRT67_03420 [Flavobacteriaceae bacterium]|nr:hypothetical protein [Flavobacteriaceae bacterium]